jgi:hypothetical protein
MGSVSARRSERNTKAEPGFIKRRNKISGQFSARLIEMLESPAWGVLSLSARRVLDRIEIELAHHGGNDNGRLPVTKLDFVAYGVSDRLVAPAIRELEALGFIRVTERGLGGNAEYRQPNLFFLTFAHGRNSRAEPPTHDWRKIKTVEEADAMAAAARARKNPNAVAIGSRNKNRNRLHKVKPAPATLGEAENPNPPATLSEATRLGYKVKPLSISWVGGTRTQLSPMCWAVPTHEVIDPRARAAIQHYWRPKLAGAHFSKKIRRETGVLQ